MKHVKVIGCAVLCALLISLLVVPTAAHDEQYEWVPITGFTCDENTLIENSSPSIKDRATYSNSYEVFDYFAIGSIIPTFAYVIFILP